MLDSGFLAGFRIGPYHSQTPKESHPHHSWMQETAGMHASFAAPADGAACAHQNDFTAYIK
jgi:hypothetical protein